MPPVQSGVAVSQPSVPRGLSFAHNGFAAHQSKEQLSPAAKEKESREAKINDLKMFSNNFKLHTPIPTDLVSLISKDPEEQKELQEKGMRNLEEAEARDAPELDEHSGDDYGPITPFRIAHLHNSSLGEEPNHHPQYAWPTRKNGELEAKVGSAHLAKSPQLAPSPPISIEQLMKDKASDIGVDWRDFNSICREKDEIAKHRFQSESREWQSKHILKSLHP
jgi:hypothetical protein